MMQIFVRNTQGNTITLNVESNESMCTVMSKFKEKEGIPSDLHLRFIYGGKFLDDWRTLTHYNILKESTLRLYLSPHSGVKTWQIYIKTWNEKIIALKVNSLDTIHSVKARIQEVEGIPLHKQSLFYLDTRLDDSHHTLSDYNIRRECTLHLQKGRGATLDQLTQPNVTSQVNPPPSAKTSEQAPLGKLSVCAVPQVNSQQTKRARAATQTTPSKKQSAPGKLTQPNVTSRVNSLPLARTSEQAPLTTPLAPQQAKRTRAATHTTPGKATPNNHSIFDTSDGEVCAEYIQGLASSADRHAISHNNYDAKLKLFALHQAKATAALSDLMPEICARPPPSVLTELEDVKRELATARSNKKELEATISELTQKNKVCFAQCASYESQNVALKVQNKKTEEELTLAHNKEKTLAATISRLKCKLSAQYASYENQIVALKSEDKKTKEELIVARSKEKEQEATISKLIHKNKVFSAQCATYESQVVALEVENKTTKEELINADKKYHARARAAGYAEGLKEGKAKRLKSVEFLHHLTDASMQYFDYGFDSCQKQAEKQGFVGQLNKDSALKEAPELKGWESSALPE